MIHTNEAWLSPTTQLSLTWRVFARERDHDDKERFEDEAQAQRRVRWPCRRRRTPRGSTGSVAG
jgi:hypothetical protein